ncbi:MAG: hypothetical protein R3E56_10240 [Burkholderiaceae bacterium]
MSASIDASFLEKIALAYWSHMGMTATSTPARLKIMELDGLSEAIRPIAGRRLRPGAVPAQISLLNLCGLTVSSLLDGAGDMFPWVMQHPALHAGRHRRGPPPRLSRRPAHTLVSGAALPAHLSFHRFGA